MDRDPHFGLQQLPTDILLYIVGYIKLMDRRRLAQTSRSLRVALNASPILWNRISAENREDRIDAWVSEIKRLLQLAQPAKTHLKLTLQLGPEIPAMAELLFGEWTAPAASLWLRLYHHNPADPTLVQRTWDYFVELGRMGNLELLRLQPLRTIDTTPRPAHEYPPPQTVPSGFLAPAGDGQSSLRMLWLDGMVQMGRGVAYPGLARVQSFVISCGMRNLHITELCTILEAMPQLVELGLCFQDIIFDGFKVADLPSHRLQRLVTDQITQDGGIWLWAALFNKIPHAILRLNYEIPNAYFDIWPDAPLDMSITVDEVVFRGVSNTTSFAMIRDAPVSMLRGSFTSNMHLLPRDLARITSLTLHETQRSTAGVLPEMGCLTNMTLVLARACEWRRPRGFEHRVFNSDVPIAIRAPALKVLRVYSGYLFWIAPNERRGRCASRTEDCVVHAENSHGPLERLVLAGIHLTDSDDTGLRGLAEQIEVLDRPPRDIVEPCVTPYRQEHLMQTQLGRELHAKFDDYELDSKAQPRAGFSY
ncbi:hypothetical protein BKA62DRAFT_715505 [Auriculariales sp. MPI-PUGE-AT-0066]|nr:hypothetical protein BKA62DRAFT_715505 [Auriculariales sp. MPI-PUGE-AT-0066]